MANKRIVQDAAVTGDVPIEDLKAAMKPGTIMVEGETALTEHQVEALKKFNDVVALEVLADELMKVRFYGQGQLLREEATSIAGGQITRLRMAGIVD